MFLLMGTLSLLIIDGDNPLIFVSNFIEWNLSLINYIENIKHSFAETINFIYNKVAELRQFHNA